MALNEITLAELEDAVKHQLGGDPEAIFPDTARQIVNDSLHYLYAMHPWSWRKRGPVTVNFNSDSEFADLPEDFGSSPDIYASNGSTFNIEWSSIEEVRRRSSDSFSAGGNQFFVAVQMRGRGLPAEYALNPRLYIWPKPSSMTTADLIYLADHVDLEVDSYCPPIPRKFRWLAIRLCKAHAAEHEDDDPSILENIERSTRLANLKAEDGLSQRSLGMETGGFMQSRRSGISKPWKNVVHPT